MTPRAIGRRLVRGLARAASLFYPSSFRRGHAADFVEIADHHFDRESAVRRPVGAAVAASRVIVSDTFSATGSVWMQSFAADPADGSFTRQLVRRTALFVGGSRHDLRLAVRAAARRPAFSLLIVGTLGLGIGASTAAFDALDRSVLRPLPFDRSEELLMLVLRDTRQDFVASVPLTSMHHWREHSTTLAQVEAMRRVSGVRRLTAGSDVLDGIGVSGGMPAMLGVKPVIGRMLVPDDGVAGAPAVIVIGERFWRNDYGADVSVVGRQITLGGKPTEIVGVWPAGARLDLAEAPDFFRTLPAGAEYGQGSWVQLLARMRPGVTREQVVAELKTITPPDPRPDTKYEPSASAPSKILLGDAFITRVWLIFAGAILLLASATANAAHLLLERAVSRKHELAVRMALGGSHLRLIRLFLSEGAVYAAAGLIAGAAIAAGLERAITAFEPRLFTDAAGAGVFGRAFAFAAASALLVTMIAAIAPLLQSERKTASAAVSGGHRTTVRRAHATTWLVGAQAALAVLLVFGASLMIHSLAKLLKVDPGIALSELAEFSVSLPAAKYPTPAARQAYFDRAADALRGIPGVTGVVSSNAPLLQSSLTNGYPRLESEPETYAPPDAMTFSGSVAPDYFSVMGMRVLAGRVFARDEADVVLVSETFARPRGDVVGRRLVMPKGPKTLLIVGVVNDVKNMTLSNDKIPALSVYFPASATDTASYRRFIARTTLAPGSVIADARKRLGEIDPAVPLLAPQTGPDVARRLTAQHRFVAVALGGLAGLGFLLAMSGVYAAVALSVVRRTREIGVRMALGARPGLLVGRFVTLGLRPVAAGAVVGLVAAWAAAPALKDLLFRVTAMDPLSAVAGIGLVLIASGLAALLPARRIVGLDPARALRDS